MKLPTNSFTQALREGEQQIGLWVSLCDNFAAEIIAPVGYDWVVLDMEHAPNDIRRVLGQLQAFERSESTALVRPQWNDPVMVKRLLDLGANGIVFPMIQNVEEAEKAVASTRYPPRGIRGISGSTRANQFGNVTDYFDRIEDETTIIIQLETQSAIAQAEEIAAVDGVSGIFFGPADIAGDLGLLGQPMAKEVWDFIMPVAKKLMAQGVPVGTLVMDQAFAAQLLKEGFSFVGCGMDTGLLVKSSKQLLADMRSSME